MNAAKKKCDAALEAAWRTRQDAVFSAWEAYLEDPATPYSRGEAYAAWVTYRDAYDAAGAAYNAAVADAWRTFKAAVAVTP